MLYQVSRKAVVCFSERNNVVTNTSFLSCVIFLTHTYTKHMETREIKGFHTVSSNTSNRYQKEHHVNIKLVSKAQIVSICCVSVLCEGNKLMEQKAQEKSRRSRRMKKRNGRQQELMKENKRKKRCETVYNVESLQLLFFLPCSF